MEQDSCRRNSALVNRNSCALRNRECFFGTGRVCVDVARIICIRSSRSIFKIHELVASNDMEHSAAPVCILHKVCTVQSTIAICTVRDNTILDRSTRNGPNADIPGTGMWFKNLVKISDFHKLPAFILKKRRVHTEKLISLIAVLSYLCS